MDTPPPPGPAAKRLRHGEEHLEPGAVAGRDRLDVGSEEGLWSRRGCRGGDGTGDSSPNRPACANVEESREKPRIGIRSPLMMIYQAVRAGRRIFAPTETGGDLLLMGTGDIDTIWSDWSSEEGTNIRRPL